MRSNHWLVTLALAGCTHVAVSAQPGAIARHAAELGASGYARIEVEQGGSFTVAADRPVVVTIPGDQETHLWGLVTTGTPDETRVVTLGTLVAGCGPDGRGPDCLASRTSGSIELGSRHRLDPAGLGVGLFGALGLVVGSACLAVCRDPNGWAYVGTGLGAVVMLAPFTTVF